MTPRTLTREAFWERAQAAWDARRDPLDDPRLRLWLLSHPEELEVFARLRCRLQTLAAAPRPSAPSVTAPLSRRLLFAAAAALLLALLLPFGGGPDPGRPSRVALDPATLRIYSSEFLVERRGTGFGVRRGPAVLSLTRNEHFGPSSIRVWKRSLTLHEP